MKWHLVDKFDNITTTAELHSSYGKVSAKAYFLGLKQLPEKEFDKLWKVVSQKEYDFVLSAASRDGKQYEWWKEEESYLDADAPITESKDDN